ncbi:hypothetical protein ACFE04_007279 [Oxalis oulophora]
MGNPKYLSLTSLIQIAEFKEIILNHLIMVVVAVLVILYLAWCRKRSDIYLLDFMCYKPPKSYRVPMSMYLEHLILNQIDPDSIAFQLKILERSGFSEETSIPPSLTHLPIIKSQTLDKEEAMTVIFSIVAGLLTKTNIHPRTIDILIVNCSMVYPTPSLCSMVINKFKMRSNIMSFNLSGMGCSAGIISVALAKDLLKVHQNSMALIVSTEMLHHNWYTGKNRSMLVTNCLFRMGGSAILMSSRNQDKNKAKYVLQHLIRTSQAHDDMSYNCISEDVDDDNKNGISLTKSVVNVAGNALKVHMAFLGPLVLPYSEQFRYVTSLIGRNLTKSKNLYVPKFRRAFQHFCVHPGGTAIIVAIEKNLKLRQEDVEASKMTLHRFGNTSSSSIWYELCYIEAKGKMKKGDKVWQLAFGSGFKCNSAVWKSMIDVRAESGNAWADDIHKYPVEVPQIRKIS